MVCNNCINKICYYIQQLLVKSFEEVWVSLSGSPVCNLVSLIIYGKLIFVFQVRWPLSLVISRKSLTKYQLIFHSLFHCKHVNRQLCAAWQLHQVWDRIISICGPTASLFSPNNGLIYYFPFLGPPQTWHARDSYLRFIFAVS